MINLFSTCPFELLMERRSTTGAEQKNSGRRFFWIIDHPAPTGYHDSGVGQADRAAGATASGTA